MQCPKCHIQLKDGTKFCGSCGSNIEYNEVNIIRTCPNCSTAIVGNEKFCGHCGRTITNNVGTNVNKNLKIENKINGNGFKKMTIMGLVGAIIVCGVAYFFYASNTKEVAKNSQSENIKQNSLEPSKATIAETPEKSQVTQNSDTSVSKDTNAEQKANTGVVSSQVLGIKNVQASSVLKPDNDINYIPLNVIDGNLSTSWVEGVEGDGLGEWITLNLSSASTVQEIVIANGYKKNETLYKENNRVGKVQLEFSDGSSVIKNLDDYYNNKEQTIRLDRPVVSSFIKVRIIEIYKGTKYSDTCISEIRALGLPGKS